MTAPPVPDISVLVADDHALMRESFRALLDVTPGLVLAGEAADGAEAVALARLHRPDVVLMDVQMPGTDGIEATRRIRASPETSSVRVIMLTTFAHEEHVHAAREAGASGFLVKDCTALDLLDGIRQVAAGGRSHALPVG